MRKSMCRFLLILSLLLTLPLQGYAAARMVSCDAALAGALTVGMAHRAMSDTVPNVLPGVTRDRATPDMASHDMLSHGADPGPVHGMSSSATSSGALHLMSHDVFPAVSDSTSHGTSHGTASSDNVQHGGTHNAHGASCMSCTPCSPGAALTCVVPITSIFVSARVVPALLVAPTSADLAHPERPPQAFLA